MSDLTLLTLLALIELGLMAIAVKRMADDVILENIISILDKAKIFITRISLAKGIDADNIAGLNMLEEVRDNYSKLNVFRNAQEDGKLERKPAALLKLGLNKDSVQFLMAYLSGDCIVYSREFTQALYIACFVPYVRPSMP